MNTTFDNWSTGARAFLKSNVTNLALHASAGAAVGITVTSFYLGPEKTDFPIDFTSVSSEITRDAMTIPHYAKIATIRGLMDADGVDLPDNVEIATSYATEIYLAKAKEYGNSPEMGNGIKDITYKASLEYSDDLWSVANLGAYADAVIDLDNRFAAIVDQETARLLDGGVDADLADNIVNDFVYVAVVDYLNTGGIDTLERLPQPQKNIHVSLYDGLAIVDRMEALDTLVFTDRIAPWADPHSVSIEVEGDDDTPVGEGGEPTDDDHDYVSLEF